MGATATALTVLLNCFHSLLIAITAYSYVPQYVRLFAKRPVAGISILGIALNTLLAQSEVVGVLFMGKEALAQRPEVPLRDLISVQQWLVLAQVVVRYSCSVLLLFLTAFMSFEASVILGLSSGRRLLPIFCFVVALGMLVLHLSCAQIWSLFHRKGDGLGDAIDYALNICVLHPIFIVFGFVAAWLQVVQVSNSTESSVLSVVSLRVQFVLFCALAINWPLRLAPGAEWHWSRLPEQLLMWYANFGWITISHITFALGQLVVENAIMTGKGKTVASVGERQPLLLDVE